MGASHLKTREGLAAVVTPHDVHRLAAGEQVQGVDVWVILMPVHMRHTHMSHVRTYICTSHAAH